MLNNDKILDSIQLVIVLYKETLLETKTFKSLETANIETNNKIDLFVYDNSPYVKKQTLSHDKFEITYKSDVNNSGLSKAYNEGFKQAILNNKKFVILLDQDTEFSNEFFTKYKQAIVQNPTIDIFAPKLLLSNNLIFSPSIYKFKRGWHPKKVNFGINSLKKLVPVNSGVMISTKLHQKVGGYNENLRVDFIDFQFMEQAVKFTDVFYLIDEIGLQEFSDESDNIKNIIRRFKIYLHDVRNIDKITYYDKITYITIIIVHTFKLSIKFMTTKFIKILING